jgi:pyridoxamine 5'-phosphate oxidase
MTQDGSDLDPIRHFGQALDRARPGEPHGGTACVLATADAEGRPSARFVLLKSFDSRGFVFCTQLRSRKARELEANPFAALCFYWASIHEQARIEGPVERLEDEQADALFAPRPRGARLAAWASRQSETLPSRAALEQAFRQVQDRFEGTEVPRPENWGGYRVVPRRVELWKGDEHRLHHRWLYELSSGEWQQSLLYP